MLTYPQIDPVALAIGPLKIHWYGLMYLIGIGGAWWLARRRLADFDPTWNKETLSDLVFWVALGVIAGGRLGYVLFYDLASYISNPLLVLEIWKGGMSFHGGALGVIFAGIAYTKRHGISTISTGDVVCLGLAPGLFLGRLANFINAELWGRPTDLPWGVAFPTVAAQDCPDIATICARHPSQLYEALLEGLILGALLIYLAWRRGGLKSEGLIGGVFLAGYGAARFIVEFVRQPDAQFVSANNPLGLAWHVNGWGLTMGQLLSLPMIAIGVFLILRATRKA